MKHIQHSAGRACLSLLLLFILMLQLGCAAPAEAGSLDADRHISVDIVNRTEGYSAVLYDNTNGLPTSEANAIVETGDGFIWIGSYAGLIRYDGNTFERMDSTNGISSIKCLFVDDQDRLWMGTNDNGVAVMEKGKFRMWSKLDGMKSAHTRAITQGTDGTIYVATTCGIVMIDPDDHLSMMEEELIAEANMRDLRAGSDGLIYGITNYGDLMTIKDGRLQSYLSAADTIVGGVGSILPDPEEPGKLYFEGADFKFHHARLGDTLTEVETIDIQPLSYVQKIEYIDGRIWICSTYGIGVIDNGDFHLLENLPMDDSVGSMTIDYLGNLWFTSTRQGVMKIVPNQFSDLFERFDLPKSVVNTTCICDDMLFIGSDTGPDGARCKRPRDRPAAEERRDRVRQRSGSGRPHKAARRVPDPFHHPRQQGPGMDIHLAKAGPFALRSRRACGLHHGGGPARFAQRQSARHRGKGGRDDPGRALRRRECHSG